MAEGAAEGLGAAGPRRGPGVSSERALWGTMRRTLAPFGRLVRVESPITPGIPDVYYCLRGVSGWVELKEHDAWPVRPGTPLRLRHLRLDQVVWLEGERAAGGSAFMLLQIGRDYLLLDAPVVRGVFRRELTRAAVTAAAVVYAQGRFPTAPLLRALTRR